MFRQCDTHSGKHTKNQFFASLDSPNYDFDDDRSFLCKL